ncbi:MAG: glycosyl hydrolases family 18-domain-containing protein [Benniella sp.]|nr:MAG: glycosyl hydrolases family 18-domain-containing protein [Benniella sp.]
MRLTLLPLAIVVASVAAVPVQKRAADNKLVVGYWVPWGDVPVSAVDFTKYTHINYGFGVLKKSSASPADIIFDRYYDGTPMRELVKRGNQYGVPILMSVGGWTGSETFSTVAADPALRKTFINNALVFVRKNTLGDNAQTPNGWDMDGIDIDWEYPGRAGAPCNTYSPQDSANYLLLLKELRAQLDLEFPTQRKLITAAVRVQPFDGSNGRPMTDVSAFVPYFDWISLMVYDIHGSWTKTTGPNAPFGTPSAPGEPFSVIQAVGSWRAAGWPSDKLVVGTAFYGAAFTATVNMDTQNPITQYVPHTGSALLKRQEGNLTIAACTAAVVAAEEGSWRYKDIRRNVLTGGLTTPAPGWTRHWDPESQTPWLFRASDKKFVSYDDPQSLTVKVNYVKQQSLRGVMLWDISYDYQQELINALNQVHCTTNCPTVTTTPAVPTSTVAVTTTSVKITTTTATIPTTTSISGICTGVPAWNSGTVYATPGTKVTYNGRLWTNQWWTQGETPSGSTWGVWKDGGAC